MVEKLKTMLLVVLVVLSLIQTYFLAYRMPSLGTMTRSDQDYVSTELIGQTSSVESVVFPEELILHLGNEEHTILYPNTQFYDIILRQRLVNREFKSFQLVSGSSNDWDDIRNYQYGIELSFGTGISLELLKKLLKIDTEGMLETIKINRILIYVAKESEDIHAFFFDRNGFNVYEAIRVDLTVKDVQDYIGFGQYLPRYERNDNEIYVATEPIQAAEMVYQYDIISPEKMQRSLFFDSSTTRAIVNRSGSQIYTDGKRGLKVEQNGLWINYTNSTASQASSIPMNENIYVAVDFVNQHGGWDAHYQYVGLSSENEHRQVKFRKYIDQYPVIDMSSLDYGYIKMIVQQGVIMEYDRTLITLPEKKESESIRWLHGGESLRQQLAKFERRNEVTALFPALKPMPQAENMLGFVPVWAVRLKDGTEEILMEAIPKGVVPTEIQQSNKNLSGMNN